MALVRDASAAQLAFQVEGGQIDDFEVVRYRGTEGLCQLYRFEIELTTNLETVPFDAIVGKPATLSISTPAGDRWFHGVVSRFEFASEGDGRSTYRAELAPELWLLTHRYNSRIFQDKSTPDIITAILTDAGIPEDRFTLKLEGTYNPRPYCVQYRETDYNFICRLMEDEGIWWYFDQTQEAHCFVACDAPSHYQPIPGESTEIVYRPPTGLIDDIEHVRRFRLSQSVRPGKVKLTDYNFENPALDLSAEGASGRDDALTMRDYPGNYAAQADGATRAAVRAQEFEAGRVVGVGQCNSFRIAPARQFDLAEHLVAELNQSYLITQVTHHGKQTAAHGAGATNGRMIHGDRALDRAVQSARRDGNETLIHLAEALQAIAARLLTGDVTARRELTCWLYHAGQVSTDLAGVASALGAAPLAALTVANLLEDVTGAGVMDRDVPVYECRFECIPATVTFRPPRVTRWPVMRGSQTARVVGPSGEEIYTDKYGRVKVQFNWDAEGQFKENASCFIRVSQGLAGGKYGMFFLPRVGHEVVVDFLEGDPDKPIITGSVYNADQMPPYTLPDEKTKSTIKTDSSTGGGGFNELRFEDKKDGEQIFIHAQKDMETRVLNDAKQWVGNDRHLIVVNDLKEQIDKNKHLLVKADLKEKVEGNANYTVVGDHSSKIDGTVNLKVAGDRCAKIDGDENLESGGSINAKAGQKYSMDAGQEIHEKAGQSVAVEGGMKVHVKGGMDVVIEAGMNLTLKAGANFIALGPSGVAISGSPTVMINSGGAAGSGSGCSPVAPAPPADPDPPEEAAEADQAEAGASTTYTPPSVQAEALQIAAQTGVPFCKKCAEAAARAAAPEPEPEEEEDDYVAPAATTWIEVVLVDEEDNPVPNERYRITLPDGTVKEGQTCGRGMARIDEITPEGDCTVTFPDLDKDAWERID
ncbi:MAG: type VI secretion system tip protein VgrG [Phycisphaerales bacterium]|nr:MAG: type VI secretion system tip protein VgrG [Phycisphaerales bacterium]